ncbi:peptidase M14 [Paenibacillus darwinianus]|uniref:Peptidase M14 n=1 Tax=Paenibacillus darwinianus TaxID=1380763 RepID=A0A9W5S3I9_9BACL|nr:M14 family metallopeptidase [Paenibacillus darwinianus]EXX89447.1 peptidase M14 [Paenibacillus darwinianus]EXX90809.1 peptidase M14 [Paenibacillus darwinianus]EXX90847.1 peptidase M14 [Paenibacillus darwinianus]
MDRYISRPGDTVLRIAERFGMEAEALYAANPHVSRTRHLAAGSELLVSRQAVPGVFGAEARIVRGNAEYGPRQLSADIDRLRHFYPFLQAGVIGQSVMGKPIGALRIGYGKRRLHVNASFHANEWITSLVLMMFLEDYCRAVSQRTPIRGCDPRELMGRTQLWLVPMVNPDGVELAQEGVAPAHPFGGDLIRWNRYSDRFFRWKANVRGVDLNDQFPAHWEEECARRAAEGPGPRDYSGEAPLSEPEAAALAALTIRQSFDMVIALHTQGQEIYWNYRDCEPAGAGELADRLGRASGYHPVKLHGSDAGYKDWFIQRFRKPGFTVECGVGVNPLPLLQADDIYDDIAPLLLEAMLRV